MTSIDGINYNYPLEVEGESYRARFIKWIDVHAGTSLFACSDGLPRVIHQSKLLEGGVPVGD